MAHSLNAGTDRSVLGFLSLGVEHMLLGWDHLLFIAGVLILARGARRAAKLITAFVLGHSATLIVATLAGWRVDAGLVDVVIVFSVVFVGLLALLGGTTRWNALTVVVLGFGLVHGLGLATRLRGLGLPEDGLLWRVIAFNVGNEIGQLTAIIAMLAVAAALSMLADVDKGPLPGKLAGAAVFLAGAVALPLVGYQAATADTEGPIESVAGETGSCTVAERTVVFPAGGGHAAKGFYGPTEETPLADFGHSIGDGLVVVLYPPSMAEQDLAALRSYVKEAQGVLAGPATDTTAAVTATNLFETLTCEELDVAAIQEFAADWFTGLE